ncbi:DUF551 domain-containing protein [Enterobacter quasiroggenkampii]|uniref:DUF551 domain-containing protein n=1 Tax=Enterobacter quasiroggenkampii TaxID=2497436 RepID=UPI002075D0EC|nr:DUF551 domain-containing protein [Enterobacter quasiroggenkampii]MCM7530938.1 DUF551 domain-containing protein [Enterobacter quasiroggenkampii]
MSNIDKEWLKQKIADMEAARDEIPFGLDEDDSNTLAAMKLALASLEAEAVAWRSLYYENHGLLTGSKNVLASWQKQGWECEPLYAAPPAPANAEPVAWLWSHRKHPSEVSLVRPEDDERAEGAHWSGWSCQALYSAPPVPVSVPDELSREGYKRRFMEEDNFDDTFRGGWNACRAAMLQGADQPQSAPQNIPENIPAMQIKTVADLYGISVPGGRTTTYSTDAAEASDCRVMGWSVQEYVKLERYQAAMLHGAENAESLPGIKAAPAMDSVDKSADSLPGNSPMALDGWVACSEQMPHIGVPVITCCGDVVQYAAYAWDGKEWQDWYEEYDKLPANTFTHWHPRPAAPQQEVK